MLIKPFKLGVWAAREEPPFVEGIATGRGVPASKSYAPLGPTLVTPVPLSRSRRNSAPNWNDWRPLVHTKSSLGSKKVTLYWVRNVSGPQPCKLPSSKMVAVVVASAGTSGYLG